MQGLGSPLCNWFSMSDPWQSVADSVGIQTSYNNIQRLKDSTPEPLRTMHLVHNAQLWDLGHDR